MFNDEYDDVEEVDVVETTTDEETIEEQDTEKEELRAENTRLKKILDRNKEYVKEAKSASKQNSPQKSDDFGLDVKSYLKSSGIKSDEFDFVKAELKRAGGDIDALLDNEYFQAWSPCRGHNDARARHPIARVQPQRLHAPCAGVPATPAMPSARWSKPRNPPRASPPSSPLRVPAPRGQSRRLAAGANPFARCSRRTALLQCG